jgi:UDP:flavonoid glycosyltransferase YjiC (YdhE family)
VTTIVLSPDFLSHYQPLGAIAKELHRRGERVVIATGHTMRPFVEADGLQWCHLDLAAGSNDGIAAAATHDRSEPAALNAFIDATRRGFVATLEFQASKRSRELLWNPIEVGHRIRGLLDEYEPDRILVDQVSLVSTLGVYATGRPFITVVPGHPTQLPVGDELYGNAWKWPDALHPSPDELATLRTTVSRVNASVTEIFNTALEALSTTARAVDDAFAVHGEQVLYHWESELHDPHRIAQLPARHLDLGPLVRNESLPAEYRAVADGKHPLVMIALGTFLVHRHDVLRAALRAVERTCARAVVAIGDHDPASFGPVPDDWVLARRVPQVALMPFAHCMISHGGNGSTQEALAAGTHHIMIPMSTDQMAIAADLVRVGRGHAADPNNLDIASLADTIEHTLTLDRSEPATSHLNQLATRPPTQK